jgi:hypothetical protein
MLERQFHPGDAMGEKSNYLANELTSNDWGMWESNVKKQSILHTTEDNLKYGRREKSFSLYEVSTRRRVERHKNMLIRRMVSWKWPNCMHARAMNIFFAVAVSFALFFRQKSN